MILVRRRCTRRRGRRVVAKHLTTGTPRRRRGVFRRERERTDSDVRRSGRPTTTAAALLRPITDAEARRGDGEELDVAAAHGSLARVRRAGRRSVRPRRTPSCPRTSCGAAGRMASRASSTRQRRNFETGPQSPRAEIRVTQPSNRNNIGTAPWDGVGESPPSYGANPSPGA